MSSRSSVLCLIVTLLTASAVLDAQVPVTPPASRGATARGGQLQRGRNPADQPNAPANRALLERQVRQALARVARRQLGLSAAQMSQLTRVDMQFEQQRRALAQRQRQTRLALRAAMDDTSAAAQTMIAQHLDTLIALERRRIDVLEAEQKELATFLTPLQRAKYQALQERVRRRLEELRVGAPGPDSALGIRPQRPRY